jgi:excisionase family DNA binding protein
LIVRRGLSNSRKRLQVISLRAKEFQCDQIVPKTQIDKMKVHLHLPKRLLRTKEAAQYLGMSPGKLRRLTQCGDLPIIQHDQGSPWLYDLLDLDSHIDKFKRRFNEFS